MFILFCGAGVDLLNSGSCARIEVRREAVTASLFLAGRLKQFDNLRIFEVARKFHGAISSFVADVRISTLAEQQQYHLRFILHNRERQLVLL